MKILFIVLFSFIASVAFAQQWQTINLSAGTMRPALPLGKFAGLFSAPLHPKIDVGVACQWNKNKVHQLLQSFNIGFGYHRFFQSIIPITSEFGYRYQSSIKIFINMFIGGGYMHCIPYNSSYALKNGEYVKADRLGIPQYIFSARIGVGYRFKENNFVEISYENMAHGPFNKEYIPLLPYNIFNLTYSFPLEYIHSKKPVTPLHKF